MKTKRTTPFITFCVPTFRVLIVVSMLSLSLTALAQRTGETAIRQLLHNQTIAWNNGDMEEFMKGYWNSDSLIFIGKSGLKYGYNTALKNYKKNYGSRSAMGSLQFDLVQVKRLSPHYYFAVGKWYLKREAGDANGHFTLVLKKINNKWLIVSDHSS